MIQYGEWKINTDITATRELYSSFEMPKDKFAKNFRAYCDMLSAEEREFFDNFGIDPKCAKVKSLGMRNGKTVPTSGYYYIHGDFVSTPHQPTVTIEELIENGLVKTFIEAGCIVSTPTCGACLGGHMGILAAGEKCLSTTNRNFVGRMGHVESEVYLCSPAVAAASAIAGRIVSPESI